MINGFDMVCIDYDPILIPFQLKYSCIGKLVNLDGGTLFES